MGQREFQQRFQRLAERRASRLVLALDVESWERAEAILNACAGHLAAVKVHPEHALLWNKSHRQTVEELQGLSGGAPVILDAKLADIAQSNSFKARYYFQQGYGAIVCHGFAGERSVRAVIEEADRAEGGVFVLAAMSNEGHLFSEATAEALVGIAQRSGAAGVIAPGNQYGVLARIRQLVGREAIILAPGIGAQGGEAGKAREAGADFAIVGRAITRALQPEPAARELKEAFNQTSGGGHNE